MTFDPNCFSYSLEQLFDPTFDSTPREAQVYSYETPWVTYQVTHNGRELVARAGTGEWTRKFSRHHEEIIAHYGLVPPQAIERPRRGHGVGVSTTGFQTGYADGYNCLPKSTSGDESYRAGWASGHFDRVQKDEMLGGLDAH